MKFIKLFVCCGLLAITLLNCSSPESPVTCTTEFVKSQLVVLEPSGQPADSLDITVYSNGEIFDICGHEAISQCHDRNEGRYTIMHDGFWGEISDSRQEISVTGYTGDYGFAEQFVFRSGECHVEKLAGPDTVSLGFTN